MLDQEWQVFMLLRSSQTMLSADEVQYSQSALGSTEMDADAVSDDSPLASSSAKVPSFPDVNAV